MDLLDRLMNLVGELVLARNQIVMRTSQDEDPALNAPVQQLNLITAELQEGVMKTRLQPIGNVAKRLNNGVIVNRLPMCFCKPVWVPWQRP